MQTHSSNMDTVAAASMRPLLTQVLLDTVRDGDWPNSADITHLVEKWGITGTIATDVPAAARMVTGYISSQLTMTLMGMDAPLIKKQAGRMWSPFSGDSVLVSTDPSNAGIRVLAGVALPWLNKDRLFQYGTFYWTGVNGTLTRINDNTRGYLPYAGLMTANSSANVSVRSENVPVVTGKPYYAAGYVLPWIGSFSVTCTITWLNAAGGTISTTTGSAGSSGGWTLVTASASAPALAVNARVNFVASGTRSSGDQFYVSEAELRPGSAPELLPQFTGFIDTMNIQSLTADLAALDGNSQLLTPVNLTMMGNSWQNTGATNQDDVRPNLQCGSIADMALRQNSYYQTPPPRPGAVLVVPAHGTLYPDYGWGTLDLATDGRGHGCFEQPTSTSANYHGTMVQFDHVGAFSGGAFGDNGLSGVTPSVVPICTGTSGTHKDYKASYTPNTSTPSGTATTFANFFANGKSTTVEAWVYISTTPPQGYASTQPLWGVRFTQAPLTGNAEARHLASVGVLANGAPYASVGAGYVRDAGVAPGVIAGSWVYVLITIKPGASTTTVTFTINNLTPQVITLAAVPIVGDAGTAARWHAALCTNRVSATLDSSTGVIASFESLQITNEASPAASSNYAWKPTAYLDYSLSPLVCTPQAATDALDCQQLLTDLAAAEGGVFRFDELGVPYFFNRARWGRSPGNTSQLSLTTANQIEDLQITYDKKSIINDVSITYAPYAIGPFQNVSQSTKPWGVHSGGGQFSFLMSLSAPTVGLDLGSGALSGTGNLPALPAGAVTQSGYRASWWVDGKKPTGSGLTDPPTNLVVQATQIDPDTARIDITNNESNPIYMVSGADQSVNTQGQPFIYLYGRPVGTTDSSGSFSAAGGGTLVTQAIDQTSIDQYRLRAPWVSPANDWCQSASVAAQRRDTLLGQLAYAKPLLQQVKFKAHPALQLGDRCTLIDTAGTALDTTSATIGTVLVEYERDWAMGADFGGDGFDATGTFRLMDVSGPIA